MTSHVKIAAILTAHPGRAEAPVVAAERHGAPIAGPNRATSVGTYGGISPSTADLCSTKLYVDGAAVAAHRVTPHYKNYLAQIPDLADRLAVVLRSCAGGECRHLGAATLESVEALEIMASWP